METISMSPWQVTACTISRARAFGAILSACLLITSFSNGKCSTLVDASDDSSRESAAVVLRMDPAEQVVTLGEGGSISFMLDDALDVRTIELRIAFDETVLSSDAGSAGEIYTASGCQLFSDFINSAPGEWYGATVALGFDCYPSGPGELFRWDFTALGDGTSLVTALEVKLYDPDAVLITDVSLLPASVHVCSDVTPPDAILDLSATQVLAGNPPGENTAIDLSWLDVEVGASVSIYRKAFGNYPEYDDEPEAGAVPDAPSNPAAAVAAGWTLVTDELGGTVFTDDPGTRDYWYYVAFVKDGCQNVSAVSNRAEALSYHLGDVAGGGAEAEGDNLVNLSDVTVFGSVYGTSAGHPDYRAAMDFGPTHDGSVLGLPTTDDVIQFEDLMIVAINYGAVGRLPLLSAANSNSLTLDIPSMPSNAEEVSVELHFTGDGAIQAMSIPVEWDATRLEFVSCEAGELLAAQGGQHLLLNSVSGFAAVPNSGRFDVALLGKMRRGITGKGTLATLRFRVVGAGNPDLTLGDVIARDRENESVTLSFDPVPHAPSVTTLHQNVPNPFNPSTTLYFDLASESPASLRVYSIGGRLMNTLVEGKLQAGRYQAEWNGRDTHGRRVASGIYLALLETEIGNETRRMIMVK